jgi:signal transduction histidine kinase
MFGFNNLDLFSVGIACASMVILGCSIYFYNRDSITSKAFLSLSLFASIWSVINYLFYQFSDPKVSFWLLRGVMFFAVWFAFSVFQLLYVFPRTHIDFPRTYKRLLIPIVALASLLTLTPFVFRTVSSTSATGQIQTVANGPGIIFFAFIAIGLNLSGIGVLIKKTLKSEKLERRQFQTVLWGIAITLTLILIFNFILPAFFNYPRFVPLGAVFILPFVLFTSYAIFKHHLMDIKIITTEILTFILAIVTLFEVIVSTDIFTIIFRLSVFLLILVFGILLIQSVLREVKQREQLQVLTKKLEEANTQLKVLDQARAEFISIASHQLRTPPATLKWYLAAILSGDYGSLDAGVKEVLVKAELTNNLQISLIEDLLNVSRIERGKMEFLFESTDVEELARITFEQLQPMAKEKGLELTYKKPLQKPPLIMADKEKLRQVINNLIDNAIKYTKKGCVIVGVNLTDDDQIRIQVTDTGKGIDEEHLKTIFDKFTRGKNSVHESTGLGLGLYVAKVVIEQHKGKIWAESAGGGQGSSFIFTIPVHNNLKQTTLLDLTANQEPVKTA